jgi:hypothetical protein
LYSSPTIIRMIKSRRMTTFADIGCRVVSAAAPLRSYSQSSIPEPLLFLPSSSSIVLTRLSGPRSRPTASQKNLVAQGLKPGPLDL